MTFYEASKALDFIIIAINVILFIGTYKIWKESLKLLAASFMLSITGFIKEDDIH